MAFLSRRRSHAAGETNDDYRFWVLAVTSIGALLASLTSGTLVIAVTSAMDPSVLLKVFSGTQIGSSGINLAPFINARSTSRSLPASS